MSNNSKQLVIFLDFWGFKKYYEYVAIQTKPKSQEYLFKAFFGLYHGYIARLKSALDSLPQFIKEKHDNSKLDFLKNTQILTISDSIVITIDCADDSINDAFAFACFLLLRVIDESVKTETHIQDFKKFGHLFYLPIRGGVSYGPSIANLKSAPPFIFSCAYNDAVVLEKQAAWPRILIDRDLAERIKSNPFYEHSISEDGIDKYYDFLKFKYQMFLNNMRVSFSKKEDRIRFLEQSAMPYRQHIEMCTKEAGLFYTYYIKKNGSEDDCPVDPKKYGKWINYYNDRINWLVENDADFKSRNDLLIQNELWSTSFGMPLGDSNGSHTICILPWIKFDKSYEANGIQLLPFPSDEHDADLQSAIREVLKSYKDIRGNTLTTCSIIANNSHSTKWSLNDEDHDKIDQAVSLFFLASTARNEYCTQLATYSNSSAFQTIFQRLSIPPTGLAVEHRRRDGRNIDGVYQHGDLKFSCPLECKSLNPKIDENFLSSLDKTAQANNNLYRRLIAALSLFKLANTDQSHMSLDAEIVTLAASFEILLDAESCYELTCKYKDLFQTYQEVTVEEAMEHQAWNYFER